MNAEVHHAPTENRYEITVDGDLAGFVQYRDEDGKRVFPHTEIAERFEGQGYGQQLVAHALEETRAAGLQVVALCPFVKAYIEKHPVA